MINYKQKCPDFFRRNHEKEMARTKLNISTFLYFLLDFLQWRENEEKELMEMEDEK